MNEKMTLPLKMNNILPTLVSAHTIIVQRQCACGKHAAGPSGECEECKQKRLAAQPPLIQAKLTIGQPNDKYEQEADRVADTVMRMPEPKVQRQPEEEKKEDDKEEAVQAKPIAGQITPLVQTQTTAAHTPEVTPAMEANINALRGGGQPLDPATRAFMEPRFGHDFSRVRVHTDARAAESARAVNALAYTVGKDVVFGVGQYAPGTGEGRKLLAHELTHVMQQNNQRSLYKNIQREPSSKQANVDRNAWWWAKFYVSVNAGEIPGALSSIKDLIMTIPDIGKLVYGLITDFKSTIQGFSWKALKRELNDLWKPLQDPSPWTAGYQLGWLIGYVVMEVAIAIVTGGSATGAKLGAKGAQIASKLSRVLRIERVLAKSEKLKILKTALAKGKKFERLTKITKIKLANLPHLHGIWEMAAKEALRTSSHLPARRLFNVARRRFWRGVWDNTAAKAYVESAGYKFTKRGLAPLIKEERFGAGGSISERWRRLTIQHEKPLSEGIKVLDASNLELMPWLPHWAEDLIRFH